jgi:hypothetical protein
MADKVAKAMRAGVSDVHAALSGRDVPIPDKVHPNTEGAAGVSETLTYTLAPNYAGPDLLIDATVTPARTSPPGGRMTSSVSISLMSGPTSPSGRRT